MNNPFKERYRNIIDGPDKSRSAMAWERSHLMIELYYALDEALGRIYELEETLSGREEQYVRDKELL